jgi:NADPH-dependent 2,4-dienoyl-CoA reductase/sulfur reductase-like enzyme
MTSSYLIIGNGIAGVTTAETLRNEDAAAEITVIGDHPMPVYTRPALKDFLAGRSNEEDLYARRRNFYAEQRLHFVFDRAVGIEVGAHSVHLRSGRRLSYDRLLLATGARARRLTCPGSKLAGVVALRTLADFQAARQWLETTRRVVVVGSGPVALETVEILHHRGYQVTHLLRGRKVWPAVLDTTASNLVLQQEIREGVDVRGGEEIVEIAGNQGRVVGVVTSSGSRIRCDLVLVAIGSEPVIDFIAASGIPCARGVKVDHTMRTGALDIFAAGDVAEVLDTITGQPRCIGQWYPAIQQGRTAAYAMLDLLGTQHLLYPSLHSNAYLRAITTACFFGYDIAAVGITAPDATSGAARDLQEVFADPGRHVYSKVLLKGGIAAGALSFDNRRDMVAFKRAIDHQVSLAAVVPHLFSQDFKLANWLDAQKVPTPILAVRKAREVNVRETTRASTVLGVQPQPQFVPPASASRVLTPARAVRLRSDNGDPYTMPVVTVPGAAEGGRTGAVTIAFLAPILPLETVRAIQKAMPDRSKSGDHLYRLSLEGDTAKSEAVEGADTPSLAPEWSHTILDPARPLRIGRDPEATLVLSHGAVSRRHAEIVCENGRYILRDLGSRNGTFVNGERLEPRRDYVLRPRDQIRIGSLLTFLFDVREAPAALIQR